MCTIVIDKATYVKKMKEQSHPQVMVKILIIVGDIGGIGWIVELVMEPLLIELIDILFIDIEEFDIFMELE